MLPIANTILPTSRLTLVPFEKKDVELLHTLFTHPYVRKYLWDNEIIPRAQTEDILDQNAALFQQHGWGLWKIQRQGDEEVIGLVGLWRFFGEERPQLLYALLPTYTGQGLATEAAWQLVSYAFNHLQFGELTAAMDEPNRASQKVAERLGMEVYDYRLEGERTLFYRIDNAKYMRYRRLIDLVHL
ncbi:MAG: GNAT family N-acetyltransferase [Bacteroidota bacterium]